jgi:hypothetical protein
LILTFAQKKALAFLQKNKATSLTGCFVIMIDDLPVAAKQRRIDIPLQNSLSHSR